MKYVGNAGAVAMSYLRSSSLSRVASRPAFGRPILLQARLPHGNLLAQIKHHKIQLKKPQSLCDWGLF